MRRGQPDDAVAKWLAGMRFAQHVESGGTLISTLSAWAALRDTWSGIEPWTTDKRLSPGQRTRLAAAIGALPDTVFKWDSAVLNEARVLETAARERTGSGSAAPPTEAETKRFLREIERVAAALEGSPDQAAATVTSFEKDARRDLHAFYRDSMPSLTKVNETRREVKAAREKLLAALK